MRLALETTQVRRRKGASQWRSGSHRDQDRDGLTLAGVVALDAVGLLLADVEPSLRDGLLVGRPVVGADQARVPGCSYTLKQAFEGGPVTTAELPVNQSA